MRLATDVYFLAMASLAGARATCPRRSVGCVLVDDKNRVLSTGYNGVPSGAQHCDAEHPCPGFALPSGLGLDSCAAIHAEQNALMFCSDIQRIATCYVTTKPCPSCTKLLLNTSCERIVFMRDYPSGVELWDPPRRYVRVDPNVVSEALTAWAVR